MKKQITLLFLFALISISHAQIKITVLSENKTPIIGAVINGYSIADSSQTFKIITNVKGIAIIEPSINGNFAIAIRAYGFENYLDTLDINTPIEINMIKAVFLKKFASRHNTNQQV